MTCHSSDSTESIENERRSQSETQVAETEQSRIATAMRDLKNTGKRLLLFFYFHILCICCSTPILLSDFMLYSRHAAAGQSFM